MDENNNILSVQVAPNTGEHFSGMGRPADNILKFKPNAIITHGMGPRALSIFQNAGIAVPRANANTVREVIKAYRQDTLEELTEGCRRARLTPQNKRV